MRLTGAIGKSNRDAIGSSVRVFVEVDGQTRGLTRFVEAGSGYASQSDMTLHFGLGQVKQIIRIEVVWPSGQRQRFEPTETSFRGVNQVIAITEGQRTVQILREHKLTRFIGAKKE